MALPPQINLKVRVPWLDSIEVQKEWWQKNSEDWKMERQRSLIASTFLQIPFGAPGKKIADLGGGPFSILQNLPAAEKVVIDPINYGDLEVNNQKAGIRRIFKKAEELTPEDGKYDEVWIINTLRYVEDLKLTIIASIALAPVVRIFEWMFIPLEGTVNSPIPGRLIALFRQASWHQHFQVGGTFNSLGRKASFLAAIYTQSKEDNPFPSYDL